MRDGFSWGSNMFKRKHVSLTQICCTTLATIGQLNSLDSGVVDAKDCVLVTFLSTNWGDDL